MRDIDEKSAVIFLPNYAPQAGYLCITLTRESDQIGSAIMSPIDGALEMLKYIRDDTAKKTIEERDGLHDLCTDHLRYADPGVNAHFLGVSTIGYLVTHPNECISHDTLEDVRDSMLNKDGCHIQIVKNDEALRISVYELTAVNQQQEAVH